MEGDFASDFQNPNSLDLTAWVPFAQGVGRYLDPFEPTFDDLVNLSDEIGTVNLYCKVVWNSSNASNFVLWLVGYWEGSRTGGAVYGFIMLAADAISFALGLPGIVALGASIFGLLKVAWTALKKLPQALISARILLMKKILQTGNGILDAVAGIAGGAGKLLKQVGGSVPAAAKAGKSLGREVARSHDVGLPKKALTIDDVFADPDLLRTAPGNLITPADIPELILDAKAKGWRVTTLGKGSQKGAGLRLIGPDDGAIIRFTPSGTHHPGPYWYVASGTTGRIWVHPWWTV